MNSYDVIVDGRIFDTFEAEDPDDFYWEDFVEDNEDMLLRRFDDPFSVYMMLIDQYGNSFNCVCLGDYLDNCDYDSDGEELD